MTTPILLYAYFEDATTKLGKTGLTPAFYIYETVKSTGASTLIVNGLAGTQIGRGLYVYVYAAGSPQTCDYAGTAEVADSSTTTKGTPALRWDGAEGWATELARLSANLTTAINTIISYLDATVSSRLATAGYTAPLSGAQVAEAVLDVLSEDHNIPNTVGAKINSAGAAADPLLNLVPGVYPNGSAGHALGRIGSGQIETTGPVLQNGDVETTQGADYYAVDGRALDWTDADGVWPDLTSASVWAVIAGVIQVAGSVVVASGAGKCVRVEPTAAITAAIAAGKYPFQVWARLSNGHDAHLIDGIWTSKRRLTA